MNKVANDVAESSVELIQDFLYSKSIDYLRPRYSFTKSSASGDTASEESVMIQKSLGKQVRLLMRPKKAMTPLSSMSYQAYFDACITHGGRFGRQYAAMNACS